MPDNVATRHTGTRRTDTPATESTRPVRHTCNGAISSGLPFGRKAPEGTCARCDELRDGAPARARFGGRLTATQRDAIRTREMDEHFSSAKHRTGGCGPVCTAFDW